jgi:hypothetical protein
VISFRYHIVSLVAALLALAAGIVIGTVALNGPVTNDLRSEVKDLKSERSDLSKQVTDLQRNGSQADDVVSAFGSKIVGGALANQQVLVVTLPGAKSATTDSVTKALQSGGATVTGRLALADDYIAETAKTTVNSLATSVHPPGLQLPETGDADQLGAALLSFVLVGPAQPTDRTAVLTAFAGVHLITSDPAKIAPAKNVVVVGTGGLQDGSYAAKAEVALITALQTSGAKVLVAGDAASASTGVVSLVRGGDAKSTISTVDDAETAFGPATVVLTLQQTIASRVGHFGTGSGADAVFPEPSS